MRADGGADAILLVLEDMTRALSRAVWALKAARETQPLAPHPRDSDADRTNSAPARPPAPAAKPSKAKRRRIRRQRAHAARKQAPEAGGIDALAVEEAVREAGTTSMLVDSTAAARPSKAPAAVENRQQVSEVQMEEETAAMPTRPLPSFGFAHDPAARPFVLAESVRSRLGVSDRPAWRSLAPTPEVLRRSPEWPPRVLVIPKPPEGQRPSMSPARLEVGEDK